MDNKKITNLKRWLDNKRYIYDQHKTQAGNQILIVHVDYKGLHPKKETFEKIAEIENTAKRRKLSTKIAGFYSGVCIWEKTV